MIETTAERSLVLPLEVEKLAPGTAYVSTSSAGQSFTAAVRGMALTATATAMVASPVWTVTVVDHMQGDTVATATVCGTQYRAAQQVLGLLAGVAATYGVTATVPGRDQLRGWLDQ